MTSNIISLNRYWIPTTPSWSQWEKVVHRCRHQNFDWNPDKVKGRCCHRLLS